MHVGHLSDPDGLPGLAHFTEHMSFLGTTKYPTEGEYAAFLAAHGGSSNAYTDTEDTCYFFEVAAPSFGETLDRFAQFFISPLFTESATARELNAIESENAKNLQSDTFRLYQLEKGRARAAHPFSKFGTGNKKTLLEAPRAAGVNLREALLAFWGAEYTAERMALVVVAPEPLDQLQKRVAPLFSQVRARAADAAAALSAVSPRDVAVSADAARAALPELAWAGRVAPFERNAGGVPTLYTVAPVAPLRQLRLAWPLPFLEDDDNGGGGVAADADADPARVAAQLEAARTRSLLRKPELYVAHLLGHEVGSETTRRVRSARLDAQRRVTTRRACVLPCHLCTLGRTRGRALAARAPQSRGARERARRVARDRRLRLPHVRGRARPHRGGREALARRRGGRARVRRAARGE